MDIFFTHFSTLGSPPLPCPHYSHFSTLIPAWPVLLSIFLSLTSHPFYFHTSHVLHAPAFKTLNGLFLVSWNLQVFQAKHVKIQSLHLQKHVTYVSLGLYYITRYSIFQLCPLRLVNRKTTNFCVIIVYLDILLKAFSSKSLLVVLCLLMYGTMPPGNKDCLTFSLPI